MIEFYLSNFIPKFGYFFATSTCYPKNSSEFDLKTFIYVLDIDLMNVEEKHHQPITIDFQGHFDQATSTKLAVDFNLETIRNNAINRIGNFYLNEGINAPHPEIKLSKLDDNDMVKYYLFHNGFAEALEKLNNETSIDELKKITNNYLSLSRPKIND